MPLEVPIHFTVPPAEGELISEIEDREFRAFAEAVSRTEYGFDYVVIDTPGHNTYLMRVSHAMADTLITPINDSFVDFDVLGRIDPETLEVLGPSHYAELVRGVAAPAASGRRPGDRLGGGAQPPDAIGEPQPAQYRARPQAAL